MHISDGVLFTSVIGIGWAIAYLPWQYLLAACRLLGWELTRGRSGRCVLMNKGKIVADMPTDELVHDEDSLKHYGMKAMRK